MWVHPTDPNEEGEVIMPDYLGKNKLHCGKKGVSGPNRLPYCFTHVLCAFPTFMFLFVVGPWWIWNYWFIGIPVELIGIYLTALTYISLFRVAYTDPGIHPRGQAADPEAGEQDLFGPPPSKYVTIKGVKIEIKHCRTCNIWRPPRTVHCRICDGCIESYDHHCPWVGNCVGRNNYRFFWTFVSSASSTLAFFGFFSILLVAAEIWKNDSTPIYNRIIRGSFFNPFGPLAIMLGSYSVLLVWSLSGLSIFHTFLSCTAQTTKEQIRGTFSTVNNPFSRGIFNFFGTVCGPHYTRYIENGMVKGTTDVMWPATIEYLENIDDEEYLEEHHDTSNSEEKEYYYDDERHMIDNDEKEEEKYSEPCTDDDILSEDVELLRD